MTRHFESSAPGRICLFGEHQDYLGLPVIASAVDLRFTLRAQAISASELRLRFLDLGTERVIQLGSADGEVGGTSLSRLEHRDYLLSALHVAGELGWKFSGGLAVDFSSDIPQQAGTSSSTAMTVSWMALLATWAGEKWTQADVARWTYRAEVQYFNEPGGMMDQWACSIGGTFHLDTGTEEVVRLPALKGEWLLLDSETPKDTLGILSRCKKRRVDLLMPVLASGVGKDGFDLRTDDWPVTVLENWSEEERLLMRATLENRDLLVRGKKAVEAGVELGELLTQQHRLLRDALEISTPRIERMLDAALAAGATGGKINGSGGGGCAFVTGPVGSGNAIADSVNGVVPEGGGRVLRIIPGEPGVRCA